MYIYINYYYCNVNSITIDINFINLLTYSIATYVSSIMYYINIVINYNKRYTLIIILIICNITNTEHLYPLKHSLGTALLTSFSSVYSYFTYMIGLTKIAACYILWQPRSIRLVAYETHRLSVRGNMDTPMRERRICDHMG